MHGEARGGGCGFVSVGGDRRAVGYRHADRALPEAEGEWASVTNQTPARELEEEWRPLAWSSVYEVSNRGRVRSLPRKIMRSNGRPQSVRGGIMRGGINANGYSHVTIARGASKVPRSVHILVAEAFLGPRPDGMFVCHSDGDPLNNDASNLRYDTPSGNSYDTVRHGRNASKLKTRCPQDHSLIEPNLMPSGVRRGYRSCLACNRAHAWCKWNPGMDFSVVSDRYYAELMAKVAP